MTDPFTSTSKIVQRLHKEYKKHPKLIIAVDFDDTVYDFHGGGAHHDRVQQALLKCNELGFYVVLWTASAPERFAFMREYMQDIGVHISAINENPIELPFGNHKKMYYNILLDDRAGLGQSLDALEIFMDDIKSKPCAEAPESCSDDVNPIAVALSNCSEALRIHGFAYPRTCKECGLGPCKQLKLPSPSMTSHIQGHQKL